MPRSNVLLSALRIGFFLTLFSFAAFSIFTASAHAQTGTQLGGGNGTGTQLGGGNGTGTQLGGGNPGCGGTGGGLTNPLGNTCTLDQLLGAVLNALIAIGTVVVTIMLVYCGFLFVAARGNEEKIRDARSALMWTVIGALVLLGAKVIAGIISATVQTL